MIMFIVIDIKLNYDSIDSVDYVDKFHSYNEAQEFIKEQFRINADLHNKRFKYCEDYIKSLGTEIYKYLGSHWPKMIYPLAIDNPQCKKVLPNFNPPDASIHFDDLHIVEIK